MLLDASRYEGDDTIKGYSGALQDLLIDAQMTLRVEICVTDAFPGPEEFEGAVDLMFDARAKHAVATGRE